MPQVVPLIPLLIGGVTTTTLVLSDSNTLALQLYEKPQRNAPDRARPTNQSAR